MRFFRSDPPVQPRRAVQPPAAPASAAAKPPIIEGWTENELVSVYNAAPVKHFKKGEALFTDVSHSESFFVVVDGSIQVTVKLNGQQGRPGTFKRGDWVAPLPLSPGLSYSAETVGESTIIEIPPAILKHLSEKAQLCIYKVATTSTSRINAYIR